MTCCKEIYINNSKTIRNKYQYLIESSMLILLMHGYSLSFSSKDFLLHIETVKTDDKPFGLMKKESRNRFQIRRKKRAYPWCHKKEVDKIKNKSGVFLTRYFLR